MHCCVQIVELLSHMMSTLTQMCASAVIGNQLESNLSLILILQPIAMKRCREGLLNSLLQGLGWLIPFS